jgi:hypothetical protein
MRLRARVRVPTYSSTLVFFGAFVVQRAALTATSTAGIYVTSGKQNKNGRQTEKPPKSTTAGTTGPAQQPQSQQQPLTGASHALLHSTSTCIRALNGMFDDDGLIEG